METEPVAAGQETPGSTGLNEPDDSQTEYGTMNITVNGNQQTYRAKKPVSFITLGEAWELEFESDSDDSKFIISITNNATNGGTYEVNEDTFPYVEDVFIIYIENNGLKYLAGNRRPSITSSFSGFVSSSFRLSINSWGGSGGKVTGTIEGVFKLYNEINLEFTNGSFEAIIK